jgi:hypothetical protein
MLTNASFLLPSILKMPFTIHIPPRRLPTLLFLTPSNTTKISISTSSPLAQKIAADAEKWGWRVERTEVGEKEWRKYVEEAGRKGWYVDNFRFLIVPGG